MASTNTTPEIFACGAGSGWRAAKAFIGLSVIGLLLSATTPLQAATYYASANCGGTEQNNTSGTAAGAECGYGITYPSLGFVSATSEADATGLYARAHGAGYTDGTADAVMSDNYSMPTGGAVPGSPGSLVFTYYIHGLSADPAANGQVRLTADNPAILPPFPGADVVFEKAIEGVATVASVNSLAVGVTLGVPNAIEVDLNLYSLAGVIDFSDTVELVGIEVLDNNGNPISGDVTGDGGFDYTKLAASNAAVLGLDGATAAPEASTWAMLLTGFLSLGGAMLKRTRIRCCAAGREGGDPAFQSQT
jgi:hypothetical protein